MRRMRRPASLGSCRSVNPMESRGSVDAARSGHSMSRTGAVATSSSQPSVSSSASLRRRYRSACVTGPRGAAYCCTSENVGLVTSPRSFTPIPAQRARASVVFPAPRSPESVTTTGRGKAAPTARPHASNVSRSGDLGAPRSSRCANECDGAAGTQPLRRPLAPRPPGGVPEPPAPPGPRSGALPGGRLGTRSPPRACVGFSPSAVRTSKS